MKEKSILLPSFCDTVELESNELGLDEHLVFNEHRKIPVFFPSLTLVIYRLSNEPISDPTSVPTNQSGGENTKVCLSH